MNPSSQTPRTDAALIDNADLHDQGYGKSNMVYADFARQLELELTAATRERDLALLENTNTWAAHGRMFMELVELRAQLKREPAQSNQHAESQRNTNQAS